MTRWNMGMNIRFAKLLQPHPWETWLHLKVQSNMAHKSYLSVHDLNHTGLASLNHQSSPCNKNSRWKSASRTLNTSWALFNRSRMQKKPTAHARLVREEGHWRVLEPLLLSWSNKNRLATMAFLLLALSTRRTRSLCSVSSQVRKSRVLWNRLENQQR